jgi:acyl dehydratase
MTRRKLYLFLSGLSVTAFVLSLTLGLASCHDASEGQTLWRAGRSGPNEVPARATAAGGSAGFTLDGDRVFFSVEVSQLDNVTMAHIHSGAAGTNGPIRVFLYGPTPATSFNGRLAEGSFTAADVTGVTFETLLEQMRTGQAYVNVHTTLYPGGEIRGQTELIR